VQRLRMISRDDLRDLLRWFQQLAAPLAGRGFLLFMQVDDPEAPSFIDVAIDGLSHETGSLDDQPERLLAEAVARYVRGRWQFRYIRTRLACAHSYLNVDEVDSLTAKAYKVAFAASIPGAAKPKITFPGESLVCELRNILCTPDAEINLDGLMRFRFTDYLRQLHEWTDNLVDEYLAGKEYDEFVGLLRYFLEISPVTAGAVHVLIVGAAVRGLDDQFTPLDLTNVEQIAGLAVDHDLQPQDVLISALISRSPERVVLHSDHPDEGFAKMVADVFVDRAELCQTCPNCDVLMSKVDRDAGSVYTTV